LLSGGVVNFALGTSGVNVFPATGTFYPIINASDNVSWQHGLHTLKFGFSYYREQDHYYNGTGGFPTVGLGMVSEDPAYSDVFVPSNFPNASQTQIDEAAALYATLNGRISSVNGINGENPANHTYPKDGTLSAYNLDEVSNAFGLYFQDSYRLRSNLTLNFGLRWDYTGANHDVTGGYHTLLPDSIFAASGQVENRPTTQRIS